LVRGKNLSLFSKGKIPRKRVWQRGEKLLNGAAPHREKGACEIVITGLKYETINERGGDDRYRKEELLHWRGVTGGMLFILKGKMCWGEKGHAQSLKHVGEERAI